MKPYSKIDQHPFAINILKLQRYNFGFFDTLEVVFFEYIVIKGRAFIKRDDFFHSSETIRKETGIKKQALRTIINRFTELGIITITVKGMPRVKHFSVSFERIIQLLPQIYLLTENGQLNTHLSQLLDAFFQPLAQEVQKKNIIKNINKNLKQDNYDSDSEWTLLLNKFLNFLNELKYTHNLKDDALKIEQQVFFRAAKQYDFDPLIKHLEFYFSMEGSSGSLRQFFKPDKIDPRKLAFVEDLLKRKVSWVDNFIHNLNVQYNSRRKLASTNQNKLPETALVINNAIKQQITDLLEVREEQQVLNAFIAYCDDVIKGKIEVRKFLPLFFSKQFGEYAVIDQYLEKYNLTYSQKL